MYYPFCEKHVEETFLHLSGWISLPKGIESMYGLARRLKRHEIKSILTLVVTLKNKAPVIY
jgi:hypothetical protein